MPCIPTLKNPAASRALAPVSAMLRVSIPDNENPVRLQPDQKSCRGQLSRRVGGGETVSLLTLTWGYSVDQNAVYCVLEDESGTVSLTCDCSVAAGDYSWKLAIEAADDRGRLAIWFRGTKPESNLTQRQALMNLKGMIYCYLNAE